MFDIGRMVMVLVQEVPPKVALASSAGALVPGGLSTRSRSPKSQEASSVAR